MQCNTVAAYTLAELQVRRDLLKELFEREFLTATVYNEESKILQARMGALINEIQESSTTKRSIGFDRPKKGQ